MTTQADFTEDELRLIKITRDELIEEFEKMILNCWNNRRMITDNILFMGKFKNELIKQLQELKQGERK